MTQFAYVAPERDPIDLKIDHILADWHEWREAYRHSKGIQAPSMTRSVATGSHWDWWNGAEAERAAELVNKQVDQAIQRIPDEPHPWHTALAFEARNLATGASVWFSPRLPADKEARDVLVLEARTKLLIELRRDGVLT